MFNSVVAMHQQLTRDHAARLECAAAVHRMIRRLRHDGHRRLPLPDARSWIRQASPTSPVGQPSVAR